MEKSRYHKYRCNEKWYSYTENEKRWANVATVGSDNLGKYKEADIGTTIEQSEITAMFVWIPRYSYEIKGEKNIEISFLNGVTNRENNGKRTKKIVHPAFTDGSKNGYEQGGWSEELAGIWIAKFEASGIDNGTPVGISNQTTSKTAYVKIVPGVKSWRYITIGDSQYRSMQMSTNTEVYGWTSGSVDSHLIKNDEWGAVAYLCYSKYGEVPKTNGSIYITGAGPYSGTTRENARENGYYTYTETHAYNTENGVLSSTTGNVYGIYDLAGGSWERVGGYLDNGNSYLGLHGKSATDSRVVYFEKNSKGRYEIKDEYEKYWCKYEVGKEEKSNRIKIDNKTIVTQEELSDTTYNTQEYNEARLRLTTEIYNKLAKYKGIGINEVSSNFSYYGINANNRMTWFINKKPLKTNAVVRGISWDQDSYLIGHAGKPFFGRGGCCYFQSGAGVLAAPFSNGTANFCFGFRPAVIVPQGTGQFWQ